ncbi:MAG: ABC transporter permease [Peptoniphilus sp.]|nr:ABC transporter permease [Peptoniphilus sp.]MDY3118465.1 ABC transporter permease [Peptoniphilus sp.]
MSYRDLFDMAKKNLLARKLRTGLTLLGVVIGCVSIIIMLSFGYGMTESNRRMIEDFGDVKNITVTPKAEGGNTKSLTRRSLKELKELPYVTDVTPVYSATVSMKLRRYQSDFVEISAMEKHTFDSMGWKMDKGSFFHGDGKGQMLFGNKAVDMFYDPNRTGMDTGAMDGGEGTDDPPPLFDAAGKTLSLSSSNGAGIDESASTTAASTDIKVVGVIEKTKKMNYDNSVFMTVEGFMDLMDRLKMERPNSNSYDRIQVRVDDMKNAEDVTRSIKDLGYEAASMLDMIKSMNKAMAVVNAIFAGIGSISFIVAAIGIANTMIMSIYERTREIGVMKVIGASIQDIQKLFLTEAALIGFSGGVMGVIFSLLLSSGFNLIGNRFAMANGAEEAVKISHIPLWLIFVALIFSTLVGIAAGYFPAKRAMNLSALEAIRSE